MATTTNYGWTTPDNTDLVKDGALAIRTLGSAIDTSMNTALGTKKAMGVLLSTVTFSAVASQSVSDVFSTTYDNYQISVAISASAGIYAQLRLRVSGTDASGANYDWGFNNVTPGGTAYQLAGSGSTSANFTRPSSGNESMANFVIANPFLAKQTVWSGTTSFNDGATIAIGSVFGGRHTLTTSYTGFTLIAASGTITGTVSVYGLNK